MKVAMVTPEFLNWGGVGSYVMQLAKNLPSDYEVHVISLDRAGGTQGPARSEVEERVTIHSLGTAKDTFIYNNQFQINLWRNFRDLQDEYEFDLLHANHAQMSDIMLKVLRAEVPSVTTVHSTIGSQRMGTRDSHLPLNNLERSEKMTYLLLPLLSTLERVYMKRCSSVIFVSDFIREWCQRSFDINCPTQVIHNGIDTTMFKPRDPSECLEHFPQLRGINNIVLYSGRMIALKGISTAIQACALMDPSLDAHFVFAGAGNKTMWRKMAVNAGVPASRCLFLDPVPYPEMLYLYPLASTFILPSYSESFPMTILEAMACGTPVVASRVGGIPEMIDSPKDGILVPPHDPAALAEGIGQMLSDHRLARTLCMRARDKVIKEFSAVTMARRTAQVYTAAVEGWS